MKYNKETMELEPENEEDIKLVEVSRIIDNLTDAQEDILKEIHAENYHGTDDDMLDHFENWLMGLGYEFLQTHLFEKDLIDLQQQEAKEKDENYDN